MAAGDSVSQMKITDLQTENESLDEFTKKDVLQTPTKPQKTLMQMTQEKEIQRLEEEIQQLDKLLQCRKELLNKHYEKTHYLDKSPKTVKDYNESCEDIKKKIEVTTKLSGITVEEFDHHMLKTGDIVQYVMVGNCNDTRFKIEFQCVENNNEDASLEIIKLDIFIPEDVQDELQKVFIKLSENRSIWGFFQLLNSYTRWHNLRKETFEHFTEKYPDMVDLVEEGFIPYLIIRKTKLKHSPVFSISWKFEIDHVYRARPKLTLGMKIPNNIVKQDSEETLQHMPGKFESMIEELGIEHAIDVIIKLATT